MVKLITSIFLVKVSRSQTMCYLNVLCGTDFTIAVSNPVSWVLLTDILLLQLPSLLLRQPLKVNKNQ